MSTGSTGRLRSPEVHALFVGRTTKRSEETNRWNKNYHRPARRTSSSENDHHWLSFVLTEASLLCVRGSIIAANRFWSRSLFFSTSFYFLSFDFNVRRPFYLGWCCFDLIHRLPFSFSLSPISHSLLFLCPVCPLVLFLKRKPLATATTIKQQQKQERRETEESCGHFLLYCSLLFFFVCLSLPSDVGGNNWHRSRDVKSMSYVSTNTNRHRPTQN